jgi:hypothetical protein
MRTLWTLVALSMLANQALADGGTVRAHEPAGPFVVTVFTSPTPFRAGPVDVSVMVQDADGGPVLDATVTVQLVDATGTLNVEARRSGNKNRLLYEALTTLPRAGSWQLTVHVERGADVGQVACQVEAAEALPDLLRSWPHLLFPPLAIVAYLLHRWRRRTLFSSSVDRSIGSGAS